MDLIEIKGKINTAICYARVVEDEAIEQIRRMGRTESGHKISSEWKGLQQKKGKAENRC